VFASTTLIFAHRSGSLVPGFAWRVKTAQLATLRGLAFPGPLSARVLVPQPVSRQIRTADGHLLMAQFFSPESSPRGSALLVPAMGVTQAFYAPLAAWLAGEGFLVATFDYRGIGRSRQGPLRDLEADIFDWAGFDCAALIETLIAEAPALPLYWIGHSLGGQILPFVPNRDRIAKAVTIAAGSGYWRENVPGLRWRAWWLWYVVVPLTLRVVGYFPGRRLHKIGDLPRGVMAQWRRWCLHPDYAVGAEGARVRAQYAAVRTPMFSLSFTDNEFMSARNIASLHEFYVQAPTVLTRLHPRDVGERRIGHFGFFRPRYAQSLWRPYLLPALV
jgi:predicted alpha/beta hydrolase